MNDLSKMYQVYVNKELQVNKNEILNVARLKQKTLSFLHDLGEVCQDSRCFIFWEKEEAIHHDELLEHYLDGIIVENIPYVRYDNYKRMRKTCIKSNSNYILKLFKSYNKSYLMSTKLLRQLVKKL